jgi:hypothetical protein
MSGSVGAATGHYQRLAAGKPVQHHVVAVASRCSYGAISPCGAESSYLRDEGYWTLVQSSTNRERSMWILLAFLWWGVTYEPNGPVKPPL